MSDDHVSLAPELVARFRAMHQAPPDWAWPYPPSIPFIGEDYGPGGGLLVYASAENLSWLNKGKATACFAPEKAWNRYRVQYDELGRQSTDFFPVVGIQPATDGGLICAARFVAERWGISAPAEPRDFLETIALTNWCKFSIRDSKNVDYIGVGEKLAASWPYVESELALLRPAAALVPKAVLARFAKPMQQASPHTQLIPVPQCNATVVNVHLARFDARAQALREEEGQSDLARWMNRIRHIRPRNAWRYLAAIERELGTVTMRDSRDSTHATPAGRTGRRGG